MQINNSTSSKTWAIKLGSAGICVPFCEKHEIIGIGWKDVDLNKVKDKKYEDVRKYISGIPGLCNGDERRIGSDTGNLIRFINDCKKGDYILYYDPPNKNVQISKVVSDAQYRNFDLDNQSMDIWHYRKVEYPTKPISIIDFDGRLKGGVTGPRLAFWQLEGLTGAVEENITGKVNQTDPEISHAFHNLRELLTKKSLIMTDVDWEVVVADYFRAQGAQVLGKIGGNQPVIDVEARFNRGELGEETWRGQVKYYRNNKVDWPEIEYYYTRVPVGNDVRFFYVSVSGFTEAARSNAYEQGIQLFEAGNFMRFFLSDKLSERLKQKLGLITFENTRKLKK